MSKSLNIHQRINAVMSEASKVGKNATIKVGDFGYKAVTHDDVAALLQPLFVKHGITCIPSVDSCETTSLTKNNLTSIKVNITLYNIDDVNDSLTVSSFGDALDNQDKGVGKAYSYAVKYALLKLFMLESRDDEESRVQNGESVNYATNSGASESQQGLIKRLLAQNGIALKPKHEEVVKGMSKRDASKSIEMLMANQVPKWAQL